MATDPPPPPKDEPSRDARARDARSQDARVRAERRRAASECGVAARVVFSVASRAHTCNVITPEEVQHVRTRLLRGARVDGLKTIDDLRHAARACEAFAGELAARLPEGNAVLAAAQAATRRERSVDTERNQDRRQESGTSRRSTADDEALAKPSEPKAAKGAHTVSRKRPPRRRRGTVVAVPLPTGDAGTDPMPSSLGGGAAVIPPRGGRPPLVRREVALDELNDEQRAVVAKHRELMLLLDGGTPAADALAQVGLDRSERWLRKLRARWNEHGEAGLIDWRWVRVTEIRISTEVEQRVLHWYVSRRAAGPKAIWELVCEDCKTEGWRAPSYQWVKLYIDSLPAGVKLARNRGMREWERRAAPVGEYSPTTYANEAWQVDHCRTDAWVRVLTREGTWVAAEVWVTAVIDVHRRAIMAVLVSPKVPNAWTSAMAIRLAILPKTRTGWFMHGVPLLVVTDHGKDLKAKSVVDSLTSVGIRFELCEAHYPNMKGEVERWFRTFQEGHLTKFAGYKKAGMKSMAAANKHVMELFTVERFIEELEQWIVTVYHRRVHEGISAGPVDRCPATFWEQTVRLQKADPRKLDVLMLQSDLVRTVTNRGIKVKRKDTGRMVFWAPQLAAFAGTQVRLRYNPYDWASVLVYHADTGDRLCEAHRMGVKGARYKNADIVQARRQARADVAGRLAAAEEQRLRDIAQSPEAWADANALATGALSRSVETPAALGTPKRSTTAGAAASRPLAGTRPAPKRNTSPTATSTPPSGVSATGKRVTDAKGIAAKVPQSRTRKPSRTPPANAPAARPAGPKSTSSGVLSILAAMERKDRGVA